jgi:hypothetical protein
MKRLEGGCSVPLGYLPLLQSISDDDSGLKRFRLGIDGFCHGLGWISSNNGTFILEIRAYKIIVTWIKAGRGMF